MRIHGRIVPNRSAFGKRKSSIGGGVDAGEALA